MAKRTRASARRTTTRKVARKAHKSAHAAQPPQSATHTAPPNWRPPGVAYEYTPELLENARRRFEETDESSVSIAADMGIHARTFSRLVLRKGWKRHKQPRDLLPAAKLLMQSERLEAVSLQSAERACQRDAGQQVAGESSLPPFEVTVDQMHRTVRGELATVQTMRAALKREPQSPIDAERTARTLAMHTATLQKLQRMQCATPQTGSHDDDFPADIDEFRNELARRIEAFVASEADEEDDGSSGA